MKLGPTCVNDDALGTLKCSRTVLNYLVSSDEYQILTVTGPDTTADLLGLRELNNNKKPKRFIATTPIIISANILLGRTRENGDEIDQLINENIGVIQNSLAADTLRAHTQFFKTFNSVSSLFAAYFNGNVDYIIVESSIVKQFIDNSPKNGSIKILNRQLFDSKIGFWVHAENPNLLHYLNSQIAAFKSGVKFREFKNTYYTLQNSNHSFYRFGLYILIALMLLVGFWYMYQHKELLISYINSYQLTLHGMMQIRPLPDIRFIEDESKIKNEFQEAYAQFQKNYPNINVHANFNNTSVKLNFKSNADIKVADDNYLENISSDIDQMIKGFPTDKFIIDLSISGKYSSINKKRNFAIINKGNRVELVDS